MDRDKLYIDGEWVEPAEHGHDRGDLARSPKRSSPTVPEASTADVDRAVAAARAAPSTPARGRR